MFEGNCEASCGTDVYRPIKYILCERKANSSDSECGGEVKTRREPCNVTVECPPKKNFGQWGCWTECEKPCAESASNPEIKSRIRKCHAEDETICVGHLEQSKECDVPSCSNQGTYLKTQKAFNLKARV